MENEILCKTRYVIHISLFHLYHLIHSRIYIYTFLYNDNVKLTQHCKGIFSLSPFFCSSYDLSLHIFNNIISRAQIRIVDITQEGEEQGYVIGFLSIQK